MSSYGPCQGSKGGLANEQNSRFFIQRSIWTEAGLSKQGYTAAKQKAAYILIQVMTCGRDEINQTMAQGEFTGAPGGQVGKNLKTTQDNKMLEISNVDMCRKFALARNTMMQSPDDCLKLVYVSVSVPIQINIQ